MYCIIKGVLKVNHHLNLEYYKSDRKLSNGEFLSFSHKFKTFYFRSLSFNMATNFNINYGNAYVTYIHVLGFKPGFQTIL